MGVSNLRVINDDTVAPGAGFGTRGHRDMEIVSYVLSGALEHKDSTGNGSVTRPGDVQRMSTNTGVRHSQYNASDTKPVHFLQVWLQPNRQGVEPGYEQRHFSKQERRDRLRLLVSRDGRDSSLNAQKDGLVCGTLLDNGESVQHRPNPERRSYAHVAQGRVTLNGQALSGGDGARVEEGVEQGDVLLFDLP